MTESVLSDSTTTTAALFLIQGHVQGIGVRPAIARIAAALNLKGNVANQSDGVKIHIEGDAANVESFAERLLGELPDAAVVERVIQSSTPITGSRDFQIEFASSTGRLATRVSPDLAVCERCLSETASSGDRRNRYSFTSCTQCGPRYSIINRMPYERVDTAMRPFDLCKLCSAEFHRVDDRRFHAQTNACPNCGPALWATNKKGELVGREDNAIRLAVSALRRGEIIAIKGIGGYQLLGDATCGKTVRLLRERKQRPSKPLAVMLDERFLKPLSNSERAMFDCPMNPIMLVHSQCAPGLADEVSCGLGTVGLMRPTSPLHWLLLQGVERPLVVTSGNVEGEPLAFENDGAQVSFHSVADLLLHNNRRIERPIDDSVVRIIAGRAVTIRGARGLAPIPLNVGNEHQLLAVGGHQKVAIALCNGEQSIVGPHFGDLGSLAARARFIAQTQHLLDLYGAVPVAIAHDLHPGYFTTIWAADQNLPTIPVQHHHAHVVSGMLEHGWLDRTVLGIAFDGSGYGSDGTIWGGEFMLATVHDFERVGMLRPFVLAGGEQAIRQPWRVALSLLSEACGFDAAIETLQDCVELKRLLSLKPILTRRIGPQTSSVGRLFDAVAVIVLNLTESSFEGEPAMRLEAACDSTADGEYRFPMRNVAQFVQLDWRPLLRQLRDDRVAQVPAGVMAMKFHRAVATAVACVAAKFPEYCIILSGGCFQNRILTELIAERFVGHPSPVGLPGIIPPNDGGLAAGQLAVAQARLRNSLSKAKA